MSFSIRLLFVLGLFFIKLPGLKGQEKSLLIYCEGDPFLMPFIENTVSSLAAVENDQLLFLEVNNLNRIYDAFNSDLIVMEAVGNHTNKEHIITPEAREIRDQISVLLTQHDNFLLVKVNTLESVLEYQFLLYSTLKGEIGENKRTLAMMNPIDLIYSSSFFVDPSKIEYKQTIKEEIQKIFPETNQPPVSRIGLSGQTLSKNFTLIWPRNKPLTLTGDYSFDQDSPKEQLRYTWSQVGTPIASNPVKPEERVAFSKDSSTNTFNFINTGKYHFVFSVFDGISRSVPINIDIEVIDPIEIKPRNRLFYTYYAQSIFGLITGSDKKKNTCPSLFDLAVLNGEKIESKHFVLSNSKNNKTLDKYLYNLKYNIDTLPNDIKSLVSFIAYKKKFGHRMYIESKYTGKRSNDFKLRINYYGVTSNEVTLKHKFSTRSVFDLKQQRDINDPYTFLYVAPNTNVDPIITGSQIKTIATLRLLSFLEVGYALSIRPYSTTIDFENEDFSIDLPFGSFEVNLLYGGRAPSDNSVFFPILYAKLGRTFAKQGTVDKYFSGNIVDTYNFNMSSYNLSLEMQPLPSIPLMVEIGARIFDGNRAEELDDILLLRKKTAFFIGAGFNFNIK